MKSIKLKTSFPIIWGDLAFQNQWLRRLAIACLATTVVSLVVTVSAMRKKPQIVVLDSQANVQVVRANAPLEVEAERAAKRYLELRYSWHPENQALQLNSAKALVAAQSMKAFEKTSSDLVTFSKGKNVAQRVYPTSINVDSKEGRIQVVADRFTEIQGLKAATLLKVNLIYQIGPRSSENPWGIYVLKEEEVQ